MESYGGYFMQKLLYITDQDEYVDHSFIAPLFEVYLKKYMTIDIIYFTDFKSDFERKDEHRFTVPSRYKSVLIPELKRNKLQMYDYDFVMVRNNIKLLQHILKYKEKYNYKVLYRFSFPKRNVRMCCEEAENKNQFFSNLLHKFKTKDETKIINRCDAFLPSTPSMHKHFLPLVKVPTILCPPAIDPNQLHDNIQHQGEEKRFFYAGTLDKVREFEIVLDAFSNVQNKSWSLSIATQDVPYAEEMLLNYPDLRKQIKIYHAKTKDKLLDFIAKADIGVALLPDLPIYSASTPVKVFNYYASAIPCLMSEAEHTSTIFTDCVDAWFCNFTPTEITQKIEYLLTLSKDDVMNIGLKGQQRLLDIKNYESLARSIATQLEVL